MEFRGNELLISPPHFIHPVPRIEHVAQHKPRRVAFIPFVLVIGSEMDTQPQSDKSELTRLTYIINWSCEGSRCCIWQDLPWGRRQCFLMGTETYPKRPQSTPLTHLFKHFLWDLPHIQERTWGAVKGKPMGYKLISPGTFSCCSGCQAWGELEAAANWEL